MRMVINIRSTHLKSVLMILPIIFLLLVSQKIRAQEPPPRPITVTVTRQLGFGAFTHGMTGGTVTISSGGIRSTTGDVILLNLGYSFSTASYEVVGNPGTLVSLLNGPDVSLPGSNGGSLTLHIGNSDPLSPFVITTVPPASTILNVGGTLTVSTPGNNPAGSYSGSFNITFVQE